MPKSKSLVDKKVLRSALHGLIKRLEKTEKFVLDQAPDICKQMVNDEALHCLENAIYAILLLFFGLWLSFYAWPHDFFVGGEERHSGDPTRYFFAMFLGSVLNAFGICVALESARVYLYLKRCTKLFLLREFKDLVG